MICQIDGCHRRAKARGYCGNHYALMRRNGKPERVSPVVNYPERCTAPGCEAPHSAKGYCPKHYARVMKYGVPDLPIKKVWSCSVDGCGASRHKAKGFCALHYERHVNDTKIDMPKRCANVGMNCSVLGCGSPAATKSLCVKHYQRWRAHGDPLHLVGDRRPKGSGKDWHKTSSGYIVRYEPDNPNAGPNGQVYQHRHVMSEMIGRPLRKDENVHHKNGNRSDNRPENLELWTKGQPAGQRVQDRVRWHIYELLRDVDAALALDPTLRAEIEALAQSLKML